MNIGDLHWRFLHTMNPGYVKVRVSTTVDHEIYTQETQFPETFNLLQARDHMLRAISEHIRKELVKGWVT